MAVLVWDDTQDRVYEAGVDRGVLYIPDGVGVPWNGLIEVKSGYKTTVEDVFLDGVRVNQIVGVGGFQGHIKAYTYPDEFAQFEGYLEDEPGVFFTGQGQQPFHLSYRTQIGNPTVGLELGYKIHILWNLIAVPDDRVYETLSDKSEAMEFEWAITSIPESAYGFRPTSYLVLDSTKIDSDLLQDFEDILYGTVSTSASLPSLSELLELYP